MARTALGGAALFAGAVVVGRRIDFSALTAAQIAWGWIAASLLLNLASILGKAVVWKITLEALPEGRRTRYAHVVPALFIGFLLNTVLFARVGEVARIAVLARRTRLAGRPLHEEGHHRHRHRRAAAGRRRAGDHRAGAAGDLRPAADRHALVLRADRAHRSRQRRSSTPWRAAPAGRVRSFVDGIVDGNAVLHPPRRRGTMALAAGTASWVAQIAGIWAALVAFDIHAGLKGAALVFVATTIVQLFPFWPGNVGMFQLGVYAPLVQLCAVPGSTAIAFGVGLQVVEALLGVGLGLVFLAREGLTFGGARTLAGDDEVRLAVPRNAPAPATMSL